jgi:aryl-alcohol dehydrogenase-like predicted oxidoreductase
MKRIALGRTGLLVSPMGIGAGGPSQIGHKTGRTESESVDLLLRAFDAGVNLVDTSEGYGTEEIIGRALPMRDRGQLIISTKKSTRHQEVTPATLTASLDASLRRLGTDYIDIYNLHGVVPRDYRRLVEDVYPTLETLKQAGKIRFIGITEMFSEDLSHAMMQQALADDLWDVVMVGFNLLNQTARQAVLRRSRETDVGVQIMFAVRKALGNEAHLREFVAALIRRGEIDPTEVNAQAPLDFVLASGEAISIPDVAYRFCRDEPGVHVVLSGTGNAEHLTSNLETFGRPSLSPESTQRLEHIFRAVVSTAGQNL